MNWIIAGGVVFGVAVVALLIREFRREFTIENLFLDAGDLD